jgi:hypothetical protein
MVLLCPNGVQFAPDAKAKVETGVQIAERQILAVLRDQRFFTVGAICL